MVTPLGVGESARTGMSPEAKDSERRVKLQDKRQKEQFVCSYEGRNRRKESRGREKAGEIVVGLKS